MIRELSKLSLYIITNKHNIKKNISEINFSQCLV